MNLHRVKVLNDRLREFKSAVGDDERVEHQKHEDRGREEMPLASNNPCMQHDDDC